jgi:hypothetical protein
MTTKTTKTAKKSTTTDRVIPRALVHFQGGRCEHHTGKTVEELRSMAPGIESVEELLGESAEVFRNE